MVEDPFSALMAVMIRFLGAVGLWWVAILEGNSYSTSLAGKMERRYNQTDI